MSKTTHGGDNKDFTAKPETFAPKGKTAVVPGGCLYGGCKTDVHRFGFCSEHYEQFKFGLIKKTGHPVPDYEKKYDHYVAYKARFGIKKVA